MTELKITQADRDFAAKCAVLSEMRELIRAGKCDDSEVVHAAARHRIAAEEGKAELVDALEDVLDSVGALSNLSEFPNCFGITEDRGREILAALARVRGEG